MTSPHTLDLPCGHIFLVKSEAYIASAKSLNCSYCTIFHPFHLFLNQEASEYALHNDDICQHMKIVHFAVIRSPSFLNSSSRTVLVIL